MIAAKDPGLKWSHDVTTLIEEYAAYMEIMHHFRTELSKLELSRQPVQVDCLDGIFYFYINSHLVYPLSLIICRLIILSDQTS